MSSLRGFLKLFRETYEASNTKHTLLNWSESEVGKRHPDLPIGFMVRDQFQADMYCGRSRIILTGQGDAYLKADVLGVDSKTINLMPQDIESLTIINRRLDRDIFYGAGVLTLKGTADLNMKSVITPSTYVQNADGSIGKIVGAEPMSNFIDVRSVFVEDENDPLPTPDVELYRLFKGCF